MTAVISSRLQTAVLLQPVSMQLRLQLATMTQSSSGHHHLWFHPRSLHQFPSSLSMLILPMSTAHHLPTSHIQTGPQVLPVFGTPPPSHNVFPQILLLPRAQESSIDHPHHHRHPFVAPTVPKMKKTRQHHCSTTIFSPKTITA